MDVSFASPALAALCNSERRLARRWGVETGRTVGRRLLELAASDARTLGRLPRASVIVDVDGQTVIDFGGEVIVRGVVTTGGAEGDGMVITGLDVQGRQP